MPEVDHRKKYAKSKIHNLGQALNKLRAAHAALKDKAAVIWAEVDYLRFTKIPDTLNDMKLESVKLKGIGTLGVRMESSCSTVDKELLIEWLKERGFNSIISTDTINSSTLKAFVNAQMREGEEVPSADMIKFTAYEMAVITK